MDTAQIFDDFIKNLKVQNEENIENRFGLITRRLNIDFYDSDSKSDHGLYVGSYGRDTAIKGISDLDLLFELPDSVYTRYNNREGNKQSQLLQDIKSSIAKTYPQTKVRGDGQVVVIEFNNDIIEICPAFRESDNSFTYPDSNNGGMWKKTDPIPEQEKITSSDIECNGNLINLCRIVRAWKDKNGVKIGGLLIDTFVHDFFMSKPEYKEYSLENYDLLIRDFFFYLKEMDDDRKYWYAPGSNQHVYKKKSNFKNRAKRAYENIIEAIDKKSNNTVYEIWRKVFGKSFPYPKFIQESSYNYTDKEEYIEEVYPVNITNRVSINCEVIQDGFRPALLRSMRILSKNKKLLFYIETTDVIEPYEVVWKVKNEGELAHRKNMLRGQLIESNEKGNKRREASSFAGPHNVECYIIKEGYCVARDRIDVPISNI
ncbi:SMODS domain-containing nucleotidyltransferase [Chryseobacterium paridis]|uniref:Adenylyl/Guanylyl and SMODS C-terminal sensor domain-containing protein n=1 Tax=Chryseobacterium paridis TaxID=2800328 RepID=A0ABS1FWZ8_9FLAO|nr:nucleotidyltransferase domain-containing protein [Chryseobacterium paridis]MBK1896937.1 hypothetical protein [Chryseobacterium paridis]